MTLEQFRLWIAPISQLVAVIVVAGTLIIWGFKLQDRVDKLDSQVQALLTTTTNQGGGSGSRDMSAECATLADRAAIAMGQGTKSGDSAANQIRALMSDLGCVKPAK